MEFDVVIIGGGPAGLSTAIKLKQLAQQNNKDISVCVLEKGSEIGAHILSGAILETKALDELFPDWKNMGAPVNTKVTHEKFLFLSKKSSWSWPSLFFIPQQKNHNNYIISLGNLCRWLAEQAENLGVDIFPGFAANEILYDETGTVKGVATGDMGVAKDGSHKSSYQQGYELLGKYCVFAEGCRGSLGKELLNKFSLNDASDPQHYGIGIKELWEIPQSQHHQGLVLHSTGWPMDNQTYGGSFMYHLENNQVSIGFVIGLNYKNPYMDPFKEFQRFKTHPDIKKFLVGGKRISYGARALNEGGFQSLPKLTFPGGVLVGCEAGTLNLPKIKGSHTAMKSGMIAAESIFDALDSENASSELTTYPIAFKNSWVYKELHKARNAYPAFHKWGNFFGMIFTGIDQLIFRGHLPFTLHTHKRDDEMLQSVENSQPIAYPKPDNEISFDRLSSVYISNTNHEEDQPCHLHLKDNKIPLQVNLPKWQEPAQRYCPAGVYEIVESDEDDSQKFQINAQNCIHCKTCDIKDPSQNINWTVPEGGGGPNYPNM